MSTQSRLLRLERKASEHLTMSFASEDSPAEDREAWSPVSTASHSALLIPLPPLSPRGPVRDRLLGGGVDVFGREEGDGRELGAAGRVDHEAECRRGLRVRDV